jgi:hypothetical protein
MRVPHLGARKSETGADGWASCLENDVVSMVATNNLAISIEIEARLQ